jgi:hypothetical protein
MGYFIGVNSETHTWCSVRSIVVNGDATPITPVIADYNQEWPSGAYYMKTIEGNGLLRVNVVSFGPHFNFYENDAPIEDYFIAGGFVDPYPEKMVGLTVQTSSSVFTLTIDAFDLGQYAGTGGTSPVTEFEWLENMP